MENSMTTSSKNYATEEKQFDPKDYPTLIKQFFRNFPAAEGIVALIFVILTLSWWILARSTYSNVFVNVEEGGLCESPPLNDNCKSVYEIISFTYVFSDLTVLLNNLFAYTAIILMIYLPRRSIHSLIKRLNDKEELNISKTSEKGQKIDNVLKTPQKYFKFIALGTLLIMIIIGSAFHYLKNYAPGTHFLHPFSGIEIPEFEIGPLPSVIHTVNVSIVAGIIILFAIDMIVLIYTVRMAANMISDDLKQREINPYHTDHMGGLKPYSTIAILLSTYNGVPYALLIPFMFQYVTTSNQFTQVITVLLIVAIFVGIGIVVWIMVDPVDQTLERFKDKFDKKVFGATEDPRFEKAVSLVLADGERPSEDDSAYFTAAWSLWSITTHLRSSVIDMDEVKLSLIKIAGPVAGFLLKLALEWR